MTQPRKHSKEHSKEKVKTIYFDVMEIKLMIFGYKI